MDFTVGKTIAKEHLGVVCERSAAVSLTVYLFIIKLCTDLK